MGGLVEDGVLIPVAEFTTMRESYSWKECDDEGCAVGGWEGVKVDLDSTNFGYGVGEVEVMVGRREEVPGAEERVRSIAALLGKQRDFFTY